VYRVRQPPGRGDLSPRGVHLGVDDIQRGDHLMTPATELPARIPPHNAGMECAILGAILLEGPAALTRVEPTVRPSDFYIERNRVIYDAMLGLHRRRQPVDLLTLQEELRRSEQLEFVGGAAALALLTEDGAVAAYLDSYVRVIRDMAILRELIQMSTHTITAAFDAHDDVDELLDGLEVQIRELRTRRMSADTQGLGLRSLEDVLDRAIAELKAGPPPGVIVTPWPSLNHLLAGGYHPGELIFDGGYPGSGKTARALEQVIYAGRHGDAVMVVSREMLLEALGRRMLSQSAHVSASALRAGRLDLDDWERINGALPTLKGLPVWMTDRVGSIAQIEALVRMGVDRHQVKLFVVDYLQLIRGPRGITDKRLEVEAVSGTLKAIAQEHKIVVIALSAMSRRERGAENRRPTVSDLRESGRLEHDADIILLGWRPDNGAHESELIVAKGRGNRTGTVEMLFFGDTLTFQEKSNRVPGDEAPF